jgi:hypothetical protein
VITTAIVYYIYRYLNVEPRFRDAICASLLLGFLMYFRAEALALPALFAAVLLWHGRSNWRSALVLLVLPPVMLLPWTIRNYRTLGTVVLSTTAGGINLWFGHNLQATGSQREAWPSGKVVEPDASMMEILNRIPPTANYEVRRSAAFRQVALRYAETHPVRELALTGKKMIYYWTVDWNHPKAHHVMYWLPSLTLTGLFLIGCLLEPQALIHRHLVLTAVLAFSNLLASAPQDGRRTSHGALRSCRNCLGVRKSSTRSWGSGDNYRNVVTRPPRWSVWS